MTPIEAFDMVLFGGTGDLVMRKLLPALYHQHQDGNLPTAGRIICLGRSVADTSAYLSKAHSLAQGYLGKHYNDADWQSFAERISYLKVDATIPEEFQDLADVLNEFPNRVRVFYLSTAPDLFAPISKSLAGVGLNQGNARVVLEKPLGHDLESSNKINDEVGEHFEEHQIYRIDHYLGKEPVLNLIALRFANTLLEPLWRREWIRDVQITVTEQVGVETRADFYDKAGALRDMIQNHLLQLLTIVAMEPPASIDADAVRDEKLKILRALKPLTPETVLTNVVRGQYRAGAVSAKPVPGYLEEPGVPANSRTETFVALKAEIQTWRWAGVPFFLRTGKRLQERLAEIVINFREAPHSIFGRNTTPNRLVIQLQPDESVRLYLMAKEPGNQFRLRPVHLDLDFKEFFESRSPEAYERLLMDVIRGDLSLFVRRDEQRAAWKWVEPILEAWENSLDAPKPYTAGTWGPAASSALLSREGVSWHEEG
ncbi:glucose-6-phosphate 1-dehydrogenase [Chitiniphilus shinanonensis]|uniref:Glucose-6-phosphate 1-dehydrogenase n=1 Tax=Chitiniphilus shinanonensis TaxID=553088 RepID=A0ABQ6BZZ9_9NEIS|nr:glucose-6-phosphate dehydrogenase [Chitiniphilus shinanonensis]GLS05493.1 glucose-6-phosphate 1-dehydrogenase [Chitiniphilus shinanonensis]